MESLQEQMNYDLQQNNPVFVTSWVYRISVNLPNKDCNCNWGIFLKINQKLFPFLLFSSRGLFNFFCQLLYVHSISRDKKHPRPREFVGKDRDGVIILLNKVFLDRLYNYAINWIIFNFECSVLYLSMGYYETGSFSLSEFSEI